MDPHASGPVADEPDPFADKPPETLQEYFVVQLRRLRRERGLSQTQLAERINYSPGLVSMVETLQRHPTPDFTERCDSVLDTGGTLAALLPLMSREGYPSWFRSYVALESEAVAIRTYEAQLIPGLLQTREYAHTILSVCWPPNAIEDIEQLLEGRLARQHILDRPRPPLLVAVLDESVLRRPVGGRKLMGSQLRHLLDLCRRPHIRLHVLTYEQSASTHLDGAFSMLELTSREQVVYAQGLGSGHVVNNPETVRNYATRFGSIEGEALSSAASAEFIERLGKELYDHKD